MPFQEKIRKEASLNKNLDDVHDILVGNVGDMLATYSTFCDMSENHQQPSNVKIISQAVTEMS